jgi:hypothetical protein
MNMRFRKRPVEVEALQHSLDFDRAREICEWAEGAIGMENGDGSLSISTLEGTMKAMPGDWIIKGVKGEFYPCKNEIFLATYEPVT